METRSQTFSYRSRPEPTPATRDLLLLEQAEWGAYSSVLTRINAVRYLQAALYDDGSQGRVTCGWDGGKLAITVYAYPLISDLVYRLTASAGTISERTLEIVQETAAITYHLAATAHTQHPILQIQGTKWLTGPYKAGGTKISPPPLVIDPNDRRNLHTAGDEPIYGTLSVQYTTRRDRFQLTLDAETALAALQEGWSEWIVAAPENGRPIALALSAPPGAEEQARLGTPCGYHIHVRVRRQDPGRTPAQPADKEISCNYCELQCDDEAK